MADNNQGEKVILTFEADISQPKGAIDELKESITGLNGDMTEFKDSLSTNGDTYGLFSQDRLSQFFEVISGNALSTIKQLEASASKLGKTLTYALQSPMKTMGDAMKTYRSAINEYRQASTKDDAARQYNRAVSAAIQINEMRSNLDYLMQKLPKGFNSNILTDKNMSRFARLSNAVGGWINEEATVRHTNMSVNEAAAFVANHSDFKTHLERMTGKTNITQDQMRSIAEFIIRSNAGGTFRNIASSRFQTNMETPWAKVSVPLTNAERLPEVMRSAYINGGFYDGDIVRHGKKVKADKSVYGELIKLANNNQSSVVTDLAGRLGLYRVNAQGAIKWYDAPSKDQLDVLSGLALMELIKARSGNPLYPRNPDTAQSQSSKVQELEEMIRVLSKQEGLRPGYVNEEDLRQVAFKDKGAGGYQIKTGHLRELRRGSTYVIPQTEIGKDGQLVYRTEMEAVRPSSRRGFSSNDQPEDKYVEIQESPYTWALGLTREQHNQFAIAPGQKNMAVIKVKADNLRDGVVQEVKAGESRPATQVEKTMANMVNGGTTYGSSENGDVGNYVFGWVAAQGKGLYMVDRELYNRRVREAAEQHLPNPFEGFNTTGFFVNGDDAATTKQINNARKGATPGVRLSEYGYIAPKYRTIDYKIADKAFKSLTGFDVLDEDEINGMAIIDPELAPTSMQGRAFNGAAKFMALRMSLPDFIKKSKAIKKSDLNGNNKLLTGTDENDFQFWVPSMAIRNYDGNPEDLVAAMRRGYWDWNRKDGAAPQKAITDQEAAQLRELYFTNAMERGTMFLTDSTIKNTDQFRILRKEYFNGMFPGQAPVRWSTVRGADGKDIEVALLNTKQQEEYMRRAGAFTGDVW